MSRVVYLYGFVPADAPAPPEEVCGIAGQRVGFVEMDGFRACVSELPADEYEAERIHGRMADLGWVGEHGAAHEKVVTWLADHATIAPARLFTIFSSAEALSREANLHAGEIRERIEHFRHVREWDLKVSFAVSALAPRVGEFSGEVAELDRRIEGASPGKRYLLERRREELATRVVADVAAEQAGRCLDELAGLAESVARQELPGGRGELPVVLKAALLVRTDRADELRAVAAELAGRLEGSGIHVALTGPWAPYRFMGEEARA